MAAGIISFIYQTVFKRTSTLAIAVVGTAFMYERFIDVGTDYIFDTINRGSLKIHQSRDVRITNSGKISSICMKNEKRDDIMNCDRIKIEHWNYATDGELSVKQMIHKLSSQGYSCTKYVFGPGTDFPDHIHSLNKKDAIISGKFRLGIYGQEVTLKPGDSIEIPANVTHNAAVVGHEDVVFIDATQSKLM